MKIVTWNVNGIRAAMRKGFDEKINELDADILCLQETKAQDHQVIEALEPIDGYHIYYNSAERKGYSGTCILSRIEIPECVADIGIAEHDTEGRVQMAAFENFNLVNVYVPNSGSKLKRLDYRAQWDVAFAKYLEELMNQDKPLILTGDLNVAHQSIDLARPEQNYDKTAGYTQVEIDGFNRLLDIGFRDIFRDRYPEKQQYTFWSQRFKARERDVGWRIDYFMITEDLVEKSDDIQIRGEMHGSDHCPVVLTLK